MRYSLDAGHCILARIDVPRDASPTGDISLVVPDDAGDLLPAPDSVYDRLGRFIESQRYLREQRGRIMRRNSCRSPWSNNTNARLSKVFPTVGGHSLELTLDVFNLLHLLNKSWGLNRGSEGDLLQVKGYDTVNGRGRYELLEPRPRVVDYDSSRWRMQLGARLTL